MENLKGQVEIQKYQFKSTSYAFKFTSYEFNFIRVTSSNPRVMSSNPRVTSSVPEVTVQIHESRVQIHEFGNHWSMETQVNSFKFSSFPKILCLKLFCNSCGNSYVSYFSTICWLRLQQETKWVNINFEKWNLTSAQKSLPSPIGFGVTFTFNFK